MCYNVWIRRNKEKFKAGFFDVEKHFIKFRGKFQNAPKKHRGRMYPLNVLFKDIERLQNGS